MAQQNSKRAAERNQKSRLLALPGWFAALVLGLLVLSGVVPGTRGAGALCALMGIGGCAWELNYWARSWRNQQRFAQSARAHAAKKSKRQARNAEQQTLQKHRAIMHAQTQAKQRQQQQAERQAQAEQVAQETAQRSARFAQVASEAERLQSLEADAFRAEAERIFAEHRLQLQQEAVTNNPVVRFAEDAVAVADVEALEAERQQQAATRAYLIGRDGFTPAAVRLSQRFPITLVEPQLLAQWKITSNTE